MSAAISRRLYPRQLRRLAVRFWREGEDRPRQGYTKNLSLTGAFVSTPDAVGRGERLRLELSDPGHSAQLYAVVVHAHRVPPEFRRFAESGMGLRFLGLDEVVGPFLGEEALHPEARPETARPPAAGGTGASPPGADAHGVGGALSAGGGRPGEAVGGDQPTGVAGGATPGGATPGGAASGGPASGGPTPRGPASGGAAPSAAPPGASAAAARPAAVGSSPATYALAFENGNLFLATYRRDLLNGGLFVTTDRPARLNERVVVDLRLPGVSAPTIRVEGRVVQVVDPRPLASGRTAGGMGLELIDPDKVLHRLAPHVAAYER